MRCISLSFIAPILGSFSEHKDLVVNPFGMFYIGTEFNSLSEALNAAMTPNNVMLKSDSPSKTESGDEMRGFFGIAELTKSATTTPVVHPLFNYNEAEANAQHLWFAAKEGFIAAPKEELKVANSFRGHYSA